MATRVLLADDHTILRAGVRSLLQTADDIEVVGEAPNGHEAVRLAAALRPDVVVMDIFMPGLNGLDAAARMVRSFPGIRIVMLSMNADEDSVLRALRSGALGYLVKTADPAELVLAVKAAARSERFLSSAISHHVVAACLRRVEREESTFERLTPRLREVLQLVAEGCSTKEIAAKLAITAKTAETYRGELMKALDIHDVASLTRFAIRNGLVSADG